MSKQTAAFRQVLEYLQSNRGISNSAAYKQIGLSANQGKARKSGVVEITEEELCNLARIFPDTLSILDKKGINCGDRLNDRAFRERILQELEKIEELAAKLKDQVKGNL
jgi:hypothetical protein